MPLPVVACEELGTILKVHKEYRLATVRSGNEKDLVLPKRDGSPLSSSSLKNKNMWWTWVARQKVEPHLPMHGLRDSFGTWVYETYGVKQAQEWLGHGDPVTTLRHYVRLTTAAREKAVAGLDEVTRAALKAAQARQAEDEAAASNVIESAARRRQTP